MSLEEMVDLIKRASAEHARLVEKAIQDLRDDFGIDATLNAYGQIEVTREQFARLQRAADTARWEPDPLPSALTIPVVIKSRLEPYKLAD